MTEINRLAFLASHNGSNMQAIVDACENGLIKATPVVVLSNNRSSGALERAAKSGLLAVHLSRRELGSQEAYDEAMCKVLVDQEIDLVILAGFMQKIGPRVLERFQRRIVNIHPALLPKYGGQGMYGINVHRAVIAAGEPVSGATIHLVDGEYDTGPIVAQREVAIDPSETAESLASKVLSLEHQLYPDTIAKIVSGEIKL